MNPTLQPSNIYYETRAHDSSKDIAYGIALGIASEEQKRNPGIRSQRVIEIIDPEGSSELVYNEKTAVKGAWYTVGATVIGSIGFATIFAPITGVAALTAITAVGILGGGAVLTNQACYDVVRIPTKKTFIVKEDGSLKET